jgi:exopolysaccharide production protein ExoZ
MSSTSLRRAPLAEHNVIKSVQLGRGLAAIAVAVYHVYLIFLQKTGHAAFESVSLYGYLGVPYFFVLSGFIIAFAHTKDINQPKLLSGYLYKRWARVYPLYWLFSVVFIFFALFGIGDTIFARDPIHMLEYFTLVHVTPEFNAPPLRVAWTLFYEVRFYLLFGLAIISLRLSLVVGAAWIAATLLLEPHNKLTFELLSFWNFAFLFGVLACILYRKLDAKWWWAPLAIGLAGIAIMLLGANALDLKDKRSLFIFPTSIGFAGIMLGLAMFEKRRSLPIAKWALVLGDASYSIYLVHSAIISALVMVVSKMPIIKHWPVEALFLPVLLSAITAGVLAHLTIERWMIKRLKRKPRRADEVAARSAQLSPEG